MQNQNFGTSSNGNGDVQDCMEVELYAYPKSQPRQKAAQKPIAPISKKRLAQMELDKQAGKASPQVDFSGQLVKLKVGKPLRKISTKQAANLRKYEAGKREKYDGAHICTGCESPYMVSCSHLVARSHSFDMVAEKDNHECQCYNCADLTERGQYYHLKNGLALMERLWNGLGEMGKQRFWYIWNQWPQNQSLWQMSSFYDSEIHN